MTINFYAILLILSAGAIFALITLGRKQNISIYLLLFGTIFISIMGQYTISVASSLEVALVGHRIHYIGAAFTPPCILFCIAKLCKIKIPKPFYFGLILRPYF